MSQQGWIKIHRKLRECYLWQDKEPFDKRSAWIDLLLSANHADNKMIMNNKVIVIERGTFITSEVKLAEKWKWNRGKVRRFLKLLESDNMLEKIPTSRLYVTIKITNYDDYQSSTSATVENTKVGAIVTTSSEQVANKCSTSEEHVENINKNDKECIKNDKNKYTDLFNFYIKLDIVKHKTLTPAMVKAIDLAMKQNGYTVEDCKALLRKHKMVIDKSKGSQYPVKKRPLVEFFGQKIVNSTALICTQYELGGKFDFMIDDVKAKDPNKKVITRRDDM